MARGTRALLLIAVAVPFLYFGTVLVSALFYPGYSHTAQYASELGAAQAPHPEIFNGGVWLTGLTCLAAGLGFARGIGSVRGVRMLGYLAGVSLALFGLSLILGAVFPLPDPRHNGWGLGMSIHLTPFLLAGALWKMPAARGLNCILLVAGVAMLVLFALTMGLGAIVTRSNIGLFQRVYALTIFPWVGLAGYAIPRFRRSEEQR